MVSDDSWWEERNSDSLAFSKKIIFILAGTTIVAH